MNSPDEPRAPNSQRSGAPVPSTESIRDEIQQFFGVKPSAAPDRGRDRAGFDRLLADLESRILGSIRESKTPPPEIGPFILEERIGRGGFAVVYRATHKRTGARAAVKLMPASDESSQRRIATEVESLIRLRHPNIVRVIDTGEDAGWAWVATDLIPGMTLADFIRTKRSPGPSFQIGDDAKSAPRGDRNAGKPAPIDAATLRLAMTWFRDLASALDALHKAGLVHRDVKPANILIDSEQRPFLIDFGLSSSAETTVDGILAGTVPYMSPEQTLGGWVAITPRSDIYSLGVTFHEALTGRRVTQGVARETMLRQIAFTAVPPPSEVAAGVPATLDPIFIKALAKDENRRYSSAKELAEDLDAWLDGRPFPHATESHGRRFGRFVRRHPVGSMITAVVALAGLGWCAWTHFSTEAARTRTLAAIRAQLDAQNGIAALALVRNALPALGDDRELYALHREAITLGSDDLARTLIESQAFAVSRYENQSAHKDLAAAAATHIEATGRADPHLLLILSLSKLFSGDAGDARAVLDRHPDVAAQSVPLLELSAIIAIHVGDAAAYEQALRRIKDLSRIERTSTDRCLTAWRRLFAGCDRSLPRPSDAEIEESDVDLSRILDGHPDHALARGLRGRLRLSRKEYRLALEDFDRLAMAQSQEGDRSGRLLVYGIAGLLTAQDESERALIPEAVTHIKQAIEREPRLLGRALCELREATPAVRAVWLTAALAGPWSARPEFDASFLHFAAATVDDLYKQKDFATVITLSDAVIAEYEPREPAHEHLSAVRQLQVLALDAASSGAAEAGNRSEAVQMVRRARESIKLLGRNANPLPYRMVARDALLAAQLALLQPGDADENVIAAVKLLRNAISPTVMDDARGRTSTQLERDEIADLQKDCKDALSRIDGSASR